MSPRRRFLVAVLAASAVLATVLLFEVLATVFFAVTVAYLLVPLQDRFQAAGLTRRWATTATTAVALAGAAIPLTLVAYVLYARHTTVLAALQTIPDTITLEFAGDRYVLTTASVIAEVQTILTDAAVPLASAIPVLALKLGVFTLLVYGLLVRHREAAAAVLATVPDTATDVVMALHARTRQTLFALYVIQVATGVVTAAIAWAVFAAFGYEYAVTLAILAGVLQFLPVVGPSVLVLALGVWEFSQGDPTGATVLTVVGLVAIAALPDLLVRPWLASGTAALPGSLYFVGFVGGILTVGVVGIIAGPLVVALVVEALGLLGDNVQNGDPTPRRSAGPSPPTR